MAKVIELEPSYSIGAAIRLPDVDALIDAGFRTIVSFRPDEESPEQTPFEVIATYASARGIRAVHLPVAPGDVNEALAISLQGILESYPGPVFGYCKSGMRAATAWALAKRADMPSKEILDRLHMHAIRSALLEQQLQNPAVLTSYKIAI